MRSLVTTLKAEYADVIGRVDLDSVSLQRYARERGISANNAAVRRHRAHRALERRVRETCATCADHGCQDCACRTAVPAPATRSACPPPSGV